MHFHCVHLIVSTVWLRARKIGEIFRIRQLLAIRPARETEVRVVSLRRPRGCSLSALRDYALKRESDRLTRGPRAVAGGKDVQHFYSDELQSASDVQRRRICLVRITEK